MLAYQYSRNSQKNFCTCGYDIDEKRILELKKKFDRNLDFKPKDFSTKKFFIIFTSKHSDIRSSNFYIITVPTPIFENKKPNLKHIKDTFKILSNYIKKVILLCSSPLFIQV